MAHTDLTAVAHVLCSLVRLGSELARSGHVASLLRSVVANVVCWKLLPPK